MPNKHGEAILTLNRDIASRREYALQQNIIAKQREEEAAKARAKAYEAEEDALKLCETVRFLNATD